MTRYFLATLRRAMACIVFLPGALLAQASDCLEPLNVEPVGELVLDFGAGPQTLEFLRISVADFVVGDVEAFTSAAYLRDASQTNPLFHSWSLTAYPQGFGVTLAASLCGEDVLDAFDSYQRLAEIGGVLGGALGSVSPGQSAMRPLLTAQMQAQEDAANLAEMNELWAAIDAFDAGLPNREGAFQMTLRLANLDPTAVMMNTDLAPDEMMARLEYLQGPELAAHLDDPALLPCPCDMEVVEAHLYGANGPPMQADSQSWGLIDQRNAAFSARLDTVAGNDDGTLSVTGAFDGALVAVTPDPEKTSPFGIVSMDRGEVYAPVSGSFTIPAMMRGDLARLPKLF